MAVPMNVMEDKKTFLLLTQTAMILTFSIGIKIKKGEVKDPTNKGVTSP